MSEAGQAAAQPASQQSAQAPAAADPVSRIQAMLLAEQAPTKDESAPSESTQQEEEYVPDGSNRQTEGDEAQKEESSETRAMAEIPLDQLEAIALEVKVKGENGEDILEKPTVKELREGYMRQKDYSRKTAEVARQREEVGDMVRQGIESERNQYVQNLQLLQQTLISTVAPELQNVDWNTLAQTDAFEYVRLKNRADQINAALSTIQQKTQEITAKQAAEQKAAQAKAAATARQHLEQKIPGWNDSIYQNLMKEGQQYGFKAEEIGTWLDPRAIEVLHDAIEYRKMQAPVTGKKVVNAPKVIKPGAQPQVTRTQAQAADAMKRLQSSGSINDAAAIIRARMK